MSAENFASVYATIARDSLRSADEKIQFCIESWKPESPTADVGTGTGAMYEILLQNGHTQIYPIDADIRMVNQSTFQTKLAISHIRNLAFAESVFDYVTVARVLQDISEKNVLMQSLSEVRRVLKTDGQILIVSPTPESYLHKFPHFDGSSYAKNNAISVRRGKGSKVFLDIPETDLGVLEDYVWREIDLEEIFLSAGLNILFREYSDERPCPQWVIYLLQK